MPKRGQRQNDASGPRTGRNNPSESMTITAGTPKKRETYEEQARERKDPGKVAQVDRPEKSTNDRRGEETGTRASNPGSGRSGSDSNADKGSRGP